MLTRLARALWIVIAYTTHPHHGITTRLARALWIVIFVLTFAAGATLDEARKSLVDCNLGKKLYEQSTIERYLWSCKHTVTSQDMGNL